MACDALFRIARFLRGSRCTVAAVVLTITFAGCRATKPETKPEPGLEAPPEETSAAPWQRGTVRPEETPAVYLEEWRHAENRHECALIAPSDLGEGEGATVRSAYFGGGWGIAYDLPNLRSAFGVAGTGVDAYGPTYDEWPYTKEWPDGSSAGYGPEGGSGPNQLAYLRIDGQQCLYNVWSRISLPHLEYLLEQLRFVRTGEAD